MWKKVKSNLDEINSLDTIDDVHNLMLELYSNEYELLMDRAKQQGIQEGTWSVNPDQTAERMPAGQAIFPELIRIDSKGLAELIKDTWYLLGDNLLNWVWDSKFVNSFRLAERYLKEKGLPWFEEYVVPQIEETYNSAFRNAYQLNLDYFKHKKIISTFSENEQETPEEILRQMEDLIGFNGLQEMHKKSFIEGRSQGASTIEMIKSLDIPPNDQKERMPPGQQVMQPVRNWDRRLEYDPFLFLHNNLDVIEQKIRDTYDYVNQINYEKHIKRSLFDYDIRNSRKALASFIKKHVIIWLERGKISAENSMDTLRKDIVYDEEDWWNNLKKEREESEEIFNKRYAPKTIDNRYSSYRLTLNLTDEEEAIIGQIEEELGPKILYKIHKDSFVESRVHYLDYLLQHKQDYKERYKLNFNTERMPGGQMDLDLSGQSKIWNLDSIMSGLSSILIQDIRNIFLSIREKAGEEKIESMNNAYLGFQDKHILKWQDLGRIDAENSIQNIYSNLSRKELVGEDFWAYKGMLYQNSEEVFNQRYSPNTNWAYNKNSSQDIQDERFFRDVINSYIFDGWIKDSYNRGVENALDEIVSNLLNENNLKERMPEGQMGFMPVETFNEESFDEDDWVYNFAKNRIPHEITDNATFKIRNGEGAALARNWKEIIANADQITNDFIQEYLVPTYKQGWDETIKEYNNKTELFKEMITVYVTHSSNLTSSGPMYEKIIQILEKNDLVPQTYVKGEVINYYQMEDAVPYYGSKIRHQNNQERQYGTSVTSASPRWNRDDSVTDLSDSVFKHLFKGLNGMLKHAYSVGKVQANHFIAKNEKDQRERMTPDQSALFSLDEGNPDAFERFDADIEKLENRYREILINGLFHAGYDNKFINNRFGIEDVAGEAVRRYIRKYAELGWNDALKIYQEQNKIGEDWQYEQMLDEHLKKTSSWKKIAISQELADKIKEIMYNDFRLKGQIQWQAYSAGLREGLAELMDAFRPRWDEIYNEDPTRRTPNQQMMTFPKDVNQKKEVMRTLQRYIPLEKIQFVLRESNEKYEPREIAILVEEKILSELYENSFISAYNRGRQRIEREIRPFYNDNRQEFIDELNKIYYRVMDGPIRGISEWFEEDYNIEEGQREAEWEEYFKNEFSFTSSHGQRSDGEQVVQVEIEEVPVEDLDPRDKKKWKKKNPQPSYLDTLPLAMKNSQNKEGKVKWQLM